MNSRLEKLLFSVSLIDKASGPASKIAADIDNITNRATQGFAQVGVGAAGLFSTGYALNSLLAPAIEMDRAIGEVKSLGVADSALKQLEKTALRFSTRYGESATDFVRASYDIQSAIAGLTGNELSKFTEAGGILAKATKSDTSTITDYMGTMYGIFQNTAEKVGKAEWVQMLAGQTASAVQMFKTTGSQMAASFANLGAEAQSQGVAMSEQMVILGTLQATMSGSEAGTKYKSFLAGVGKAQDELGLKFTDSHGKLLPMVNILQTIQGKFGDIDTVAESDALKKAFGTKEAVGLIKLLSQNIDGLSGNINALGRINGMDKAMEMADAMVDPWERLAAVGVAVKTVFGRVLQPVLVPLVNKLIGAGDVIVRWTGFFPNLTRVVGIGTLVVFGLVAAVSAFTLVGGVAKMAMAGWSAIMLINTGVMKVWRLGIVTAQATWFLFNAALWGGGLALKALRAAFVASTVGTWLFNSALLANPITWVVLAVVALVGILRYLVIKWDTVTAAFKSSDWGQALMAGFDVVAALFNRFIGWLGDLKTGWQSFTAMLSNITVFSLLGEGIDWLIEKINLIPGINIDGNSSIAVTEKVEKDREAIAQATPGVIGGRSNAVPAGGLLQQISQATTHNKGTTVEKIEINTNQPVNGFMIADELAMI